MKIVINHDFKATDGTEYKKGDQPDLEFNAAKELIHQGLAAAVNSQDEVGVENVIAPQQPEASDPILYTNQEGDANADQNFVKEDAKKQKTKS